MVSNTYGSCSNSRLYQSKYSVHTHLVIRLHIVLYCVLYPFYHTKGYHTMSNFDSRWHAHCLGGQRRDGAGLASRVTIRVSNYFIHLSSSPLLLPKHQAEPVAGTSHPSSLLTLLNQMSS